MSWIEIPSDPVIRGLDLSLLKVDEAYFNITTDEPFHLYSLSDDCYKCPFSQYKEIESSQVLTVSTKNDITWRLFNISREINSRGTIQDKDVDSMICEVRAKQYGEFGIYDLIVQNGTCILETIQKPVNIYLPLLLILLGILILVLLYLCILFISKKCLTKQSQGEQRNKDLKKKRIKAVDTFRGISIVMMIFFNYGGGHYWHLDHATWNGLHLADIIFPWFMWIMGVCIPIAMKAQLKRNTKRTVILLNIIRRSIILFLLGLSLNTVAVGPNLESLRIFGVLQRFSITYFVVAFISVVFTFGNYDNTEEKKLLKNLKDIVYLLPQWMIVLILLAVHCYLVFFFPVPGCPTYLYVFTFTRGYLGPGGRQYDNAYHNCTGGATGYIDMLVLGYSHLYQHPTASEVYGAGAFDPEGLLGCLTSIFQVFLGVQAGAILIYHGEWFSRIKRWLIWGTVFGAIGAVLCQARQEGGWIPINKNIWSLSFVCVTSCLGFYLLSLLYYLIDVKKVWTGAPFVYPGMNATILYVGHMLCYQSFPWRWSLGNMNTHFILTLEAIWGTALWVIISYWLYTEKFFLSL